MVTVVLSSNTSYTRWRNEIYFPSIPTTLCFTKDLPTEHYGKCSVAHCAGHYLALGFKPVQRVFIVG